MQSFINDREENKMGFEIRKFKDIDLNDKFFDSLKTDYVEFSDWFEKKSEKGAIIHFDKIGRLNGFLYLKLEDEILDIAPPKNKALRLKVGTMKIDAHGTRLGERFIKKIFDYALLKNVTEIYVTIFDKHSSLIELFQRYNFNKIGLKHSSNGSESVFSRAMSGTVVAEYPFIKYNNQKNNIYFLSIYPVYHSRLFPDSILKTESSSSIVKDISYTNSIHKIYIAGMRGMDQLKKDDIIVIYRTKEDNQPALYSAVFTSVCVIEETKSIFEYTDYDSFYQYCKKYSIFSDDELLNIYKSKKYPYIIKMSYNVALTKRIIRKHLIDMRIMSNSSYSGFGLLDYEQLLDVFKVSQTNESIIIDQA